MMKRKILISIFFSMLMTLVQTTCASTAELKLNTSDGTKGDNFDRSISISGDYASMGTFSDDEAAIGIGVNTGMDESTSAHTEIKGITIFVLIGIIVGVAIIRILNELIFNLFSNI
jgi:F0F1-type ATP synthase assembly protein I